MNCAREVADRRDAQGTVTQRLLGALSPENVGLVLTRGMTVEDGVLTIKLETATAAGESVTRTLIWRRVVDTLQRRGEDMYGLIGR